MPSEQYTPLELTQAVAALMRGITFTLQNEETLQRGVAQVLDDASVDYTRELRLDARNRLDFVVHSAYEIAIEVKIAGTASDVQRQVRRYLKEDIGGLVLVTTRRRHRALENEAFPKPVEVVWLGFSGF